METTATNPSFILLILISHLHITSLQRVNLLSWVISVIFSILVIYKVYVHCRSTLRVLIWSLYRICYWIRRGSLAVCLYSNPHIHFAFACSDCSLGFICSYFFGSLFVSFNINNTTFPLIYLFDLFDEIVLVSSYHCLFSFVGLRIPFSILSISVFVVLAGKVNFLKSY